MTGSGGMGVWRIDEPAAGPGRVLDDAGAVRAMVCDRNPLADAGAVAPERGGAGAVVAWTGWYGRRDGSGVTPLDPRVWTDAGWSAFEAACGMIAGATGGGHGVWFRPHARHVLGDAQRCRVAARGWAERGQGFGLLLEPAALLTPSMLEAAADHIARMLEAVGDSPALAGIVASDLELVERDDEPGPAGRAVAFGRGALGAEAFIEGVRLAGGVPGGAPVLVHAGADGAAASLPRDNAATPGRDAGP